MAKNIEPNLKLISEYLKLNKSENFVIPEYQRRYSWDITQCDKLWQDIEAFIASDATDPYFFGTIIVDCSLPGKFSLIDGQQRTTTFLLLLKALLFRLNDAISKIPNDEDSEALLAGLKANRNKIITILYKADDEDIPAFLKDPTRTHGIVVLENNSINEVFDDEIRKILEAADFYGAEQSVHRIPRKQKDNKYTNHFRNFKFFYMNLGDKSETQLNQFAKVVLKHCQVIEIRSWQIEQAITMFNSLNSTGMPLSDADIISAQLYSNAGDDKLHFNGLWEAISKLANELSIRKVIDIDGVLQQYMYIKRAIGRDYISEKEDGNLSVDVTTPGLRRYYTEINKGILKEPLKFCADVMRILQIWDTVKDLPIVKLLLRFNENTKLYLSAYLFRFEVERIDNSVVRPIAECLLRLFTILELTDLGYSSSKFKTFLFSQNVKFVDASVSTDEIIDDFNDHISRGWTQDDLRSSLLGYEKNLLVYLNEYVYAKSLNRSFDFQDNVNVEHVMPASGRNITAIQQDAGFADKDDFMSYVNRLGNKILLEEQINKALSNDWFKTKKQTSVIERTGYKDSKFALALMMSMYTKDEWTKQDIDWSTGEAAKRILQFIFEPSEVVKD